MDAETEEKFNKLYNRVFYYALSRTKNKDAAHDLVMDVYTKILAKFRDTNELPEQLEFYTIRAIRNKHIDQVRATRRIDYINDIVGYVGPVDESVPSDPFMKERIHRAFGDLSEICQQTLGLIAQGWQYNEIHTLTDMPLNTVASTVFRCRKKYRKNLDGLESESNPT